MKTYATINKIFVFFFSACAFTAPAQDILPPVMPWTGKSLQLIAEKNNKWITPAEKTGFENTPTYKETMDWLSEACKASSQVMQMIPVGISANNRSINMVIASSEG